MDAQRDVITRRDALVLLAGTVAFVTFGPVQAAEAKTKAKAKKKKKKKKRKPKIYKIVYHLNGGKQPSKQVLRIKEKKILAVSALGTPMRYGYTFKGWYKNEALTKAATEIKGKARVTKRTLYAKWQETVYSIKYVVDGGVLPEGAPTSFTTTSDDIALPQPTRDQYVFGGWYKDKDFATPATKIKTSTLGNRTYYAKWLLQDPWESYMQGKCSAIAAQHEKVKANGDSFVFITDAHVPDNNMYSPVLIKRIVDATPVQMVVFGGDVLNWNSVKSSALARLRQWHAAFDFTTLYSVRGNHDANDEATLATSATTLTDEEYYWLMLSEVSTQADHPLYYYHDNTKAKIRYLFLDTDHPTTGYMAQAQATWMKARIMELSSSWSVVVIMHQLFNGNLVTEHAPEEPLSLDPNAEIICPVLDELYTRCQASIIGIIAGHCHRDYVSYSSVGYPMITTTCDAGGIRSQKFDPDNPAPLEKDYQTTYQGFDPDNPERPAGTTNGQAFDVFSIDTKKRKIYATRVGAGKDREFTY